MAVIPPQMLKTISRKIMRRVVWTAVWMSKDISQKPSPDFSRE